MAAKSESDGDIFTENQPIKRESSTELNVAPIQRPEREIEKVEISEEESSSDDLDSSDMKSDDKD